MDGWIKELNIDAMEAFINECETMKTEFNSIKGDFESINNSLNSNWDGYGGEAYEKYSGNIFEKLGDFAGTLDSIKKSITDIMNNYNSADEDLYQMNITAGDEEN